MGRPPPPLSLFCELVWSFILNHNHFLFQPDLPKGFSRCNLLLLWFSFLVLYHSKSSTRHNLFVYESTSSSYPIDFLDAFIFFFIIILVLNLHLI
jgi:hypothetical protein